MKRALFIAAFILSACASTPPDTPADMTAILSERADGTFILDLTFAEPHTALVFGQAPTPYRGEVWQSQTPGATVESIGALDAILFEQPATKVRFTFPPHTEDLPKAYTPFLEFSDGSWGVLTGQFRLFSAEGRDQIEAFTDTANEWEGEPLSTNLSLISPRRVTVRGETYSPSKFLRPEGDGTYAFIGELEAAEGDSFVGFIDPGLPAWINDSFDSELTEIFSQLASGWGFDLPQKSTVLLVYKGAESDGLFLTGGTLDGGLLSLEVGGNALLEPDDEILNYLQWFFAHEGAHLFQKAFGSGPAGGSHSWIHEGSANTMAHDVAAQLSQTPDKFLMDAYAGAFERCTASLSQEGSLSNAGAAGDFDAYYACGDLMALVTDAALPEHSLYDFWNELKDQTIENGETKITTSQYLATMRSLGASPGQMADIERLANEPIEHPGQFLEQMLADAGLPMTLSPNGTPTSFTLRAAADKKALMRRARISG